MNNIYVDGKMPETCWECEHYNYEKCSITGDEFDDVLDCHIKIMKSCEIKPLSDRLAEERKKVVQMIKAEFEPSPDSTVIEGTPTPEAELVNRGFSVCKKRVYKVLDRIEKGEL